MEYMFKYDVYGKVENKEIKILELIPIKRRYVIKLKDDEVSSAKQLIDLLNHGTTLQELEKPVSYTHLTLPTTSRRCRSRWSPYH